jgi:hypothetical protein
MFNGKNSSTLKEPLTCKTTKNVIINKTYHKSFVEIGQLIKVSLKTNIIEKGTYALT